MKNPSSEIESSSKDSLTPQVSSTVEIDNKVAEESSTSHVNISETESSTTEKSEQQSNQVDIDPRSDQNEFFFETTSSPPEAAKTENQQPDLIFIDAVDNGDVKSDDESFNEIWKKQHIDTKSLFVLNIKLSSHTMLK